MVVVGGGGGGNCPVIEAFRLCISLSAWTILTGPRENPMYHVIVNPTSRIDK